VNDDFLDALQQIAREKDIAPEALREMVEQALITAYRKNFAGYAGEIRVRIDPADNSIHVYRTRTVVDDEVMEPDEIYLDEARQLYPECDAGDTIETEVNQPALARIAAQTAKQVVVQRLKEAERDRVMAEYTQRVGEVLTGQVQRREYRNILINIGKVDGVLPPEQQVNSEPYRVNDRLKVYVVDVRATSRGPQVTLSRTAPSLIRQLFELEVPEISDGIVLIKAVAREPGARSKIAVFSRDDKVDPVGSCVGHRGSRVQAVVNELYDEKIDIIRWSSDIAQFVAEALSPAKVTSVQLTDNGKTAFVIVPDTQLSLAIGKCGQNVRLAARLTGCRIDIRSESQAAKGHANPQATASAGPDAADGTTLSEPDDASVAAADPMAEPDDAIVAAAEPDAAADATITAPADTAGPVDRDPA
jgi:N utilization substance protein A